MRQQMGVCSPRGLYSFFLYSLIWRRKVKKYVFLCDITVASFCSNRKQACKICKIVFYRLLEIL